MGGLQASRTVHRACRDAPAWSTAPATNIAFNAARAYRARSAAADGMPADAARRRRRRLFSASRCRAEQLATRVIAEQAERTVLEESGAAKSRDARVRAASPDACSQRDGAACRSNIDQTGGISIAQLAARARRLKRQRGLDVARSADYLQLLAASIEAGRGATASRN
jgi:replicative DNA helicase